MLVDAHIHIGRENSGWAIRPAKDIFMEYKNRGILGIRDGGDTRQSGLAAREAAAELGIVFKTPIVAFTKRGGYGGFLGWEMSGTGEIREKFNELLPLKPDLIKVICSGILVDDEFGHITDGGFDQDELDYLVKLSHDHGFRVMGHCLGSAAVEKALNAGVDSIEHAKLATEEQLYRMKEQGAFWTPTIAGFANELKNNVDYPKEMQKVLAMYVEHQYELLRKGVALGVKIALGSDSGPRFSPHGQTLLDEIEYFVEAGIPRETVLKLCEENGAALLDF